MTDQGVGASLDTTLLVVAYEFHDEAAAQAWLAAIVGDQAPVGTPIGRPVHIVQGDAGERIVTVDGRFGFEAVNDILGDMTLNDPATALDVATTIRAIAPGAPRVDRAERARLTLLPSEVAIGSG